MAAKYDVYTPDSVIAAAVPFGNEDPREVAYNNAAYALDRDAIHLIYSVDGRYVYYIAASSSDFAGHPNAATPLAAALPGMKEHQGDGAYVTISGSAYAVIIKRENDMFSYVGDKQSVDAFIASHGVPTVNTLETALAPWEGFQLGSMRRAAELAKISAVTGILVLVLAIAGWFYFALKSTDYSDTIDQSVSSINRSIQTSITKLSDFTTHPLQKSLEDLQRITILSTEVGGWVKKYEVDDKGNVGWTVELPRWVTGEYLDKFGKGLNISRPSDSEFIIVEKPSGAETSKRRRR